MMAVRNILQDKISPMRAGGEKVKISPGKIFSRQNFPAIQFIMFLPNSRLPFTDQTINCLATGHACGQDFYISLSQLFVNGCASIMGLSLDYIMISFSKLSIVT